MIQINNGYATCYYLLENGTVYDKQTNKIIMPDKRHMFCLKDQAGHKKYVSLRPLYKLLYNSLFYVDNIENLDNEQWKIIDDTDNKYLVSNKGRIKSLHNYNAILLKSRSNQSGYDRVDISYTYKTRSVLVHRLVAQYFLPSPDRIDMQLHHKDFDIHNNAADNLEWVTPDEHINIHKERNKQVNE